MTTDGKDHCCRTARAPTKLTASAIKGKRKPPLTGSFLERHLWLDTRVSETANTMRHQLISRLQRLSYCFFYHEDRHCMLQRNQISRCMTGNKWNQLFQDFWAGSGEETAGIS